MDSNPIRLRSLTPSDLTPEVVERIGVMIEEMKIHKGETPAPTLQTLSAYLGTGSQIIVAEHEGRMVGQAMLTLVPTPNGTKYQFDDFFVDPEVRRRGLAKQLFAAICEELHRRGGATLHWVASAMREEATHFYQEVLGCKPFPTNAYRHGLFPR